MAGRSKAKDQMVTISLTDHESSVDRSSIDQSTIDRLIQENAELRQQLESLRYDQTKYHQETELIQDLMVALASSFEIKQVIYEILRHLNQVIPYDRASFYFLEEDGQRLIAAEDLAKPLHSRRTLSTSNPILKELRGAKEPLAIPDIQADPRFKNWPGLDFVRGWVGAPLFAKDRMVGFITLGSLNENVYHKAQIDLLHVIANQVAEVLDKILQFEKTKSRAEELEAISNISTELQKADSQEKVFSTLVELASKIFHATSGAYLSLQWGKRELVVQYSLDHSLIGRKHTAGVDPLWEAVDQSQPIFIPNLDRPDYRLLESIFPSLWRGMQSAIILPLSTPDFRFGLLHFSFSEPRDFLPEDWRFLKAISEIGVTAVQSAAVLESMEQKVAIRTRHLSTLYEISALTNETLELQDLLDRALQATLEAMDSPAGTIHLADKSRKSLRLAVQRNIPAEILPQFEILSLRSSFWKNLFNATGPLVLPNPNENEAPFKHKKFENFQAFLGAPMRASGQSLGLISLYGENILYYTIEDINLFTTIVGAIAKVVERERLYKQAEQAAITEERQRLARELHDSITQMLYSLVLYCGAGRRALKQLDLELLSQHLEKIDQTSQQALKEMRLLVYELRPSIFQNEGIIGALQHRLESVEKRTGINVQMIVEGEISLNETSEFELYRIAEEALNNALKHANATSIRISIRANPHRVELEVSDNGIGFDLDEMKTSHGLGLVSIQERAREMGGVVRIITEPGQGTRVRVIIREAK